MAITNSHHLLYLRMTTRIIPLRELLIILIDILAGSLKETKLSSDLDMGPNTILGNVRFTRENLDNASSLISEDWLYRDPALCWLIRLKLAKHLPAIAAGADLANEPVDSGVCHLATLII